VGDTFDFGISLDDMMSGPAKAAASSLSGLMSAMTGGMTASSGMSAALDAMVPGLGEVAGAAAGVVSAFASLTVGVVEGAAAMAIQATQAKQAMISMFGALGGSEAAGRATEEMLTGLSEKIGITKDQLAPLTRSFMAMGITGTDALQRVTLAAASAQAIMGDPAAANTFEMLQKKIQLAAATGTQLKIPERALTQLAQTGLTVDDIAKRMGVSAHTLGEQLKNGTVNASKFGDAMTTALIEKGAGPLERMGNSVENLKGMLSQSFSEMFADAGDAIGPFLAQVKDLFSIFSQTSESGKAMKTGIGGALKFIFDAATKVVPYIKHFFLDLMILSLKAYILLKSHWSQITLAFKGVALVLGIIAAVAVGATAVLAAPFIIGAAAVTAFGAGLVWVADKIMKFGPTAIEAGKSFVTGLIDGISAGATAVADAVKGLASKATGAFKSALGISSPSKVMMSMGGHMASGVAEGLDAGQSQVASASADLGMTGAKAMTGGGGASSGGGSTGPITIQITAPNGVTNALELTEVAVAALFERLMLQQGA
jgi:hypothetical protein